MTNNKETYSIISMDTYKEVITGISWEQLKRLMFTEEVGNGTITQPQKQYRDTHFWVMDNI